MRESPIIYRTIKGKKVRIGYGYYVESVHTLKNGNLGKRHVSRSFPRLRDAVKLAHSKQDGNSVVRIIDATNIIGHKEAGSVNLHKQVHLDRKGLDAGFRKLHNS